MLEGDVAVKRSACISSNRDSLFAWEGFRTMNRLRECRLYLGFSEAEVAKVMGMREEDVREMELTGRVDDERLVRLGHLYRRKPGYLRGEVRPSPVHASVESVVASARLCAEDAAAVREFARFLADSRTA